MLIAICSACRWMERSEESLYNRFSGWENHIVTPKHLGKIVPKIKSAPNMKLEIVHSLQTHFADSCVSERKVRGFQLPVALLLLPVMSAEPQRDSREQTSKY